MSADQEQVRGKELMCFDCGMTRWICLSKFDGECCSECEHPAVEQGQVGGVDVNRVRNWAKAYQRLMLGGLSAEAHTACVDDFADDEGEYPFITAADILALVDELEQLRVDAADWRRVTERAWDAHNRPVSDAQAEVAPAEDTE